MQEQKTPQPTLTFTGQLRVDVKNIYLSILNLLHQTWPKNTPPKSLCSKPILIQWKFDFFPSHQVDSSLVIGIIQQEATLKNIFSQQSQIVE